MELREKNCNNWAGFYAKRINSSYQDYFNKRYKPLIDLIVNEKPGMVREEGVGIGSISKALQNSVDFSYGFDLCREMVTLCKLNNPEMSVYRDNIIVPNRMTICDIAVTHGVLEHFNDSEIHCILKRYKNDFEKNVHYVPTDGYDKPSFGDERLLPYKYWLDKFKPKDYLLFNDDKDLLIINL